MTEGFPSWAVEDNHNMVPLLIDAARTPNDTIASFMYIILCLIKVWLCWSVSCDLRQRKRGKNQLPLKVWPKVWRYMKTQLIWGWMYESGRHLALTPEKTSRPPWSEQCFSSIWVLKISFQPSWLLEKWARQQDEQVSWKKKTDEWPHSGTCWKDDREMQLNQIN